VVLVLNYAGDTSGNSGTVDANRDAEETQISGAGNAADTSLDSGDATDSTHEKYGLDKTKDPSAFLRDRDFFDREIVRTAEVGIVDDQEGDEEPDAENNN